MDIFIQDEFAIIHNTSNVNMDGRIVKVCGVLAEYATNIFYIVTIIGHQKPGWSHFVIANACLKKIY